MEPALLIPSIWMIRVQEWNEFVSPNFYGPLAIWPWLKISPQSSLNVIYLSITALQWLMSFPYTPCIPMQIKPIQACQDKGQCTLPLREWLCHPFSSTGLGGPCEFVSSQPQCHGHYLLVTTSCSGGCGDEPRVPCPAALTRFSGEFSPCFSTSLPSHPYPQESAIFSDIFRPNKTTGSWLLFQWSVGVCFFSPWPWWWGTVTLLANRVWQKWHVWV